MAKFSRSKGRRGEQQLVIFLSKLGYKAERVLNQAHTPGLYDVSATKDGKVTTFEVKTYQDAFSSLYQVYYHGNAQIRQGGHVLTAKLSTGLVALSTDFEALTNCNDMIFYDPSTKLEERVWRRLVTLKQKVGRADFLCLKDNNKPRLFLRYWN